VSEPEITYAAAGRIARLQLNRPDSGNAITPAMPGLLASLVERANLDPAIHVIHLSGAGRGFCGGYDLALSAERMSAEGFGGATAPAGSPLDPAVQRANHDPHGQWDPMVDHAMMGRFARGFMSLFHSEKPVVCTVQGYCVAGGTDLALCSDLLVIEDEAKIGYPPARVWGVPTTMLWAYRIGPEKAKRLLSSASASNVTTGTPCSTARSMAGVTTVGSVTLMASPSTPAPSNSATCAV